MQLTPEQVAGLPADQQAQVLALQQHMVSRFPSGCSFFVIREVHWLMEGAGFNQKYSGAAPEGCSIPSGAAQLYLWWTSEPVACGIHSFKSTRWNAWPCHAHFASSMWACRGAKASCEEAGLSACRCGVWTWGIAAGLTSLQPTGKLPLYAGV